MSFEEKRQLLLQLDVLIRNKTKGRPHDLSRILKISESTFFRLIDHMRNELEAPIAFDEQNGCYFYEEMGLLFMGFMPQQLICWNKLEDYCQDKLIKQCKTFKNSIAPD